MERRLWIGGLGHSTEVARASDQGFCGLKTHLLRPMVKTGLPDCSAYTVTSASEMGRSYAEVDELALGTVNQCRAVTLDSSPL